jgi:hypothetical protein
MTAAHDMQRYARHLLLAEIGTAGQARLCAARVRIAGAADARATRTACDYLERAGLSIAAGAGEQVEAVAVADANAVRALAGCVELEEAAAALAGAFAAVETIKAVLGAGVSAQLPAALTLAGEVRA